MLGKYILPAFIVILLVCSPVAASTSKISAGAPVFIGETNMDISAAVQDCHVVGWWPAGANMSAAPAASVTVKNLNEAIGLTSHFNVSPQVFMGHAGNWYCVDKQMEQPVLTVLDPQFTIRFWDLDTGKDVSGQTVPMTANISYRIDTNLDQYANYYNRTNLNPSDTVFTITMTDPRGRSVTNLYSGSAGAADTVINTFDSTPFIKTPVYYGKGMDTWNRLSRDAHGELLYPAGTYIITATQNLGNMQQAYSDAGITDTNGRTTGSTSITFSAPPTLIPTAAPQKTGTPSVTTPAPAVTGTLPPQDTPAPTTQPVATRTTYSPLPWWVTVMAAGLAGLVLVKRAH